MGLLESSRSRARLRRLIFSFAIPPLFRYDDLVCFFSRRRYGKENTEAKDQHEPKRYNDENKAKHEGQRVHASVFVSRVPAKDVPSTSPRRYGGQRVGYRNNYAQVRDCPACPQRPRDSHQRYAHGLCRGAEHVVGQRRDSTCFLCHPEPDRLFPRARHLSVQQHEGRMSAH